MEKTIQKKRQKGGIDEISKTHNNLLDCIRFAGVATSSFNKERLKCMNAWELIKVLALNNIKFLFNKRLKEE